MHVLFTDMSRPDNALLSIHSDAVPRIGETVETDGDLYVVTGVTWMPDETGESAVEVEMVPKPDNVQPTAQALS